MKTLVMCIFVFCLFRCGQKPDEYYVGKENAEIVADLKDLFESDFYTACMNYSPKEEEYIMTMDDPYLDACSNLFDNRPIAYNPEEEPAYGFSQEEWDEWNRKLKENGCSDLHESNLVVNGFSEQELELNVVLRQRGRLRSKINLTGAQKDNLPSELEGLIYEGWVCNENKGNIRFGEPVYD